jgi:hypothetical protein
LVGLQVIETIDIDTSDRLTEQHDPVPLTAIRSRRDSRDCLGWGSSIGRGAVTDRVEAPAPANRPVGVPLPDGRQPLPVVGTPMSIFSMDQGHSGEINVILVDVRVIFCGVAVAHNLGSAFANSSAPP